MLTLLKYSWSPHILIIKSIQYVFSTENKGVMRELENFAVLPRLGKPSPHLEQMKKNSTPLHLPYFSSVCSGAV
jgi:hypothetical protein